MKKLLMFLCLVAALISCKKNSSTDEEHPGKGKPVPTAHGEPMGNAVTQTIGPAGGIVEVPGGNLVIDIPAGALDGPTNISVQPVTSTLEKFGVGQTFRLGPEDVKFKKDVSITMTYADTTDLRGKDPSLFSLAFQDQKGYWHFASNPQILPQTNSITVQTRHFSDWVIMSVIAIDIIGPDKLSANESTKLQVSLAIPPTDDPIDDLLGPSIRQQDIGGWQADIGKLTGEKEIICTYQAPEYIQKETDANITVTLKGMNLKKYNPNLGSEIEVGFALLLLPEEYMHFKVDGGLNFAREFSTLKYADTLVINAQTGGTSLQIVKFGGGKVSPFGLHRKPGTSQMAYVLSPQRTYVSQYYTCQQDFQTTAGNVVILRDDNKVGGFVEGEFFGKLNFNNFCVLTESVRAEGKFRVKIRQLN